LIGAIFATGFLGGPAVQNHPFLDQNKTWIAIGCILLGCPMGLIGLHRIRHGCWQGLGWPFFGSAVIARSKRGAALSQRHRAGFASAFRAQVWFEWRRQSRKLAFYVSVLSGVPLLAYLVLALISQAKLNSGTVVGLGGYLLVIPVFVHFVCGLDPERGVPAFTALRPLRNDEIAAAKLTAIALGSLLSWIVTLGMIAVLLLIGDTHDVSRYLRQVMTTWPIAALLPLVLLGPIFIAWRFVAADLCFGFAGKSWVSKVMVLKTYVAGTAIVLFIFLSRDATIEKVLLAALPFFLGTMLIFKFTLAQIAFRRAVRRALVDRSLMVTYVSAWLLVASAFSVPTLALFHEFKWVISACLGILLALPLARIAFVPIAIGLGRHR
jgi:hypothetical protein